ncbi:hypothetical protein [Celeribacter ethanolicus]|uniref:hypothetical protein n=1 Tax=Celeribacter ethanolicus TaxID=1758178 RepID=UPI00082F6FE9|nr:hypothetical protein [Celeribacter ethanolicus]
MSAASVKPLFRAISGQSMKAHSAQMMIAGCDREHRRADGGRDPLDFDPTPPSAIEAVLREEAEFIRAHGNVVWENAVGAGHCAKVLSAHGFEVLGSDVVDRGWGGDLELRSFLDYAVPRSRVAFTNPPYNLINARDGHGWWLRHSFDLGLGYVGLLLNADWPAARINGMDALLEEHPPSVEYLCCWKIDFRGGGAPPQRNSWFIWDENRPAPDGGGWLRKRLYKDGPDPRQEVLL